MKIHWPKPESKYTFSKYTFLPRNIAKPPSKIANGLDIAKWELNVQNVQNLLKPSSLEI